MISLADSDSPGCENGREAEMVREGGRVSWGLGSPPISPPETWAFWNYLLPYLQYLSLVQLLCTMRDSGSEDPVPQMHFYTFKKKLGCRFQGVGDPLRLLGSEFFLGERGCPDAKKI